jgi:anti-sigma factor RsiW
MAQDRQLDELLGAYLSGDISPEERAAVERLLASDASRQNLVRELGNLLNVLKQGNRPVSDHLVAQLRERMALAMASEAKLSAKTIMAASVSGDITAQERATLQKYFTETPAAKQELGALRALNSVLKKGELVASDELSKKLHARLRAKLPAAAMTSSAPVAAAPTAPTPSLRIYAAPENPWRKRLAFVGLVSAAAAALTIGVFFVQRDTTSTPPENLAKENVPAPAPEHPRKVLVHENNSDPTDVLPPRAPEIVRAPENQIAPVPPQDIIVQNPTPKPSPAPVAPENALPPKNVVVETAPEIKTPQVRDTPKMSPPEKTIVASDPTVKPAIPNIKDTPKVPDAIVNVTPPLPPADTIIPDNINPPRNPAVALAPNDNPTISSTPNVTPNPKPDDANDAIVAQADSAVVGALRGGSVEVAKDGVSQPAKMRDTIVSGSRLFSGEGRVALVLPDNGRLTVNTGTDLVISFNNKNTLVTLTRGEVSYKAGNGSLTLIAGNVQITSSKGVDVKIEDGKRVVATTGDRNSASFSMKNGKTSRMDSNTQMVAMMGSDDPPKSTKLSATLEVAWDDDLVLPGEGVSNNGKTPASDTPNQQTKPSRRPRR